MRIKPVILGVCVCMLMVSAAGYAEQRSLWAPVYPGALQCNNSSGENISVFFSRDSFEKIEEFYDADRGDPPLKRGGGNSRTALFIYRKSVPGDASSIDGVQVSYNETCGYAAASVLKKLEQLILDGALDRQEFAEIHRRYERMGHYFELSAQRDKGGRNIPVDKMILQKYEQQIEDYIDEGETWEENEEELMNRYHSLIGQGKFKEAAALMQAASTQSIEAARRPADRKVVELWKECLAEMETAAYPVRIEIGRKR
ncbi:MAG: hypothetical protein ACLFNZ_10460 [Spirochaetaceae bacterium]